MVQKYFLEATILARRFPACAEVADNSCLALFPAPKSTPRVPVVPTGSSASTGSSTQPTGSSQGGKGISGGRKKQLGSARAVCLRMSADVCGKQQQFAFVCGDVCGCCKKTLGKLQLVSADVCRDTNQSDRCTRHVCSVCEEVRQLNQAFWGMSAGSGLKEMFFGRK